MSQLRTHLEEYATTIDDILQTCDTDAAIQEAAEKAWPYRGDQRRLVFLKLIGRFPNSPNDTGGCDVHLPNEMPIYLTEYAKAINDILQLYQTEQAMKDAAKQRWASDDPRFLVFSTL